MQNTSDFRSLKTQTSIALNVNCKREGFEQTNSQVIDFYQFLQFDVFAANNRLFADEGYTPMCIY